MDLADEIDKSWTDFLTSDEMTDPLPAGQLRAFMAQTAVSIKMVAAAIDRLKTDLGAKGIELDS